jgi:hypothetical protein
MTSLLGRFKIVLFDEIAFAIPHLSHFISLTQGFKPPAASVSFDHGCVTILTSRQSSRWSDGPLRLLVTCKPLDWQIDCAAQICTALIPTLSGVEQLRLEIFNEEVMLEWEIDGTTWHELLRPFNGVKELHIEDGLLKVLSRALQADEVGSAPGFLPNLEHILAADNLFAPFIDTRRSVGRPIQFLKSPRRPPVSSWTNAFAAHRNARAVTGARVGTTRTVHNKTEWPLRVGRLAKTPSTP